MLVSLYTGKLHCSFFFSNMDQIFDMKCISEKRCWYCKNLCDYCLQPAAFGLCYPSSYNSELLLKFCAKSCERHFICLGTQLQVTIELIPLHNLQEIYIPNGHQELFRIQGLLVLSEHQAISFYLSVRIDSKSKSKYVIYSENQQYARKYFEISITSEGRFISFLPHIHMQDDSYEEDLVLFDYLSVHIETGFLLYEKYLEGDINPGCTLVIPIGIDYNDPFYENCCCFPKQSMDNKWRILLNSLHVYRLLRQLKNQELLIEHIVGTAIKQLQSIQMNCPAEHARVYKEVFNTAQEVLCEIILSKFESIYHGQYMMSQCILGIYFSCVDWLI